MTEGRSHLEIGAELFPAETIVKTHVTRILMKLGVRDPCTPSCAAHDSGLMRR